MGTSGMADIDTVIILYLINGMVHDWGILHSLPDY